MIECMEHTEDAATFMRRFGAAAKDLRVPLNGGMDLTYRCNLRCLHCYAGPEGQSAAGGEMPTDAVKAVLDQVVDAGCLFMLLSGGEPLLRPDFGEIYRHAKRLGLLVTVFTNATLVDDAVASLFEEWPPVRVETTLYGATGATHDAITGVTGSFDRALAGVDRLLGRGVRMTLKTIVMKDNIAEFDAMEKVAQERGVPFRMDSVIFPRLNGDRSPLEQLVSPADAVRAEMSNRKRADAWREYTGRAGKFPPSDRRYDCGAGISTFHVDPCGNLFPCLMARDVSHSLREATFIDGWKRVIPKVREEPATADSACGRCDRRAACAYCPGMLGPDAAEEVRRHVCDAAIERQAAIVSGWRQQGEVAA
jgi:radical SAM protein with 4Fe4S-binding SPASM domain